MKTKTDFEKMTTLEIREECKGKVKNYGKMTKAQMIDALLNLTENPASEEPEEVYTDRHNLPIVKGQRVSVRVGSNWFPGSILKLKKIEDEDYASILLDGKDLPKLIHSVDIDSDVPSDGTKKPVKEVLKEEKVEETNVKSNETQSNNISVENPFVKGTIVIVEKSDKTFVDGEVVDLKFNEKGVPFYRIKVDGKIIGRVPKFVKVK